MTPEPNGLPMDKLGGRTTKLLAGALGSAETVIAQMNGASASQTLVITATRVIVIKVGFRTGQTVGTPIVGPV